MGNYMTMVAAQDAAALEEVQTPAQTEAPRILSGAQALMESLIAEGTEVIFGYPGGAIMPTYDALFDYTDRLSLIHI